MVRGALRRLRASERLVGVRGRPHPVSPAAGLPRPRAAAARRSVWRYLTETAPYDIDVTLLTVADRLATRGRNADAAIAAHLSSRARCSPRRSRCARRRREPIVRGDDLARALGIAPGPELGALLAQLEEDRFAGEIATPRGGDQAGAGAALEAG